MEPRRSLGWPILLGVVLIGSIITLGVGWVLLSVAAALGSPNRHESAGFYWAVFGVGVALLAVVLAGVIVYLALTIKAIALSQRQSNFIDSVTHELKSPLASLKLSLQTLARRPLPPEQEADFHRFMLRDVERLDMLIDHLLDAAKTLQRRTRSGNDVTLLEPVLRKVCDTVVQRHGVSPEAVRLELAADAGSGRGVIGREADLEIVFRNLIDNAVKYSLPDPRVEVSVAGEGERLTVRVADNGPGIPVHQRRRVFRRFVRLGSELERSKPGTGLGLFLVQSLVKQMRGRVSVRGRLPPPGTIFEVDLPVAT